jgi:hypothetical protein
VRCAKKIFWSAGGGQKAQERRPDQETLLRAEQTHSGHIRFDDDALAVQGEVADRGKIIEVRILPARRLHLLLCPPELLVLHFELDLVRRQLMDETLDIPGGNAVRPVGLFFEQGFRTSREGGSVLFFLGSFFIKSGNAAFAWYQSPGGQTCKLITSLSQGVNNGKRS